MSYTIKKQQGMTFSGGLVVLALIGFFSSLGLKTGSIYLEHYAIKQVVESLKDEPLITQKSASKVKYIIMHRLNTNGIYDLKRENITVKKSPGILDVTVAYTVQKKMVGNIDILVSFSDNAKLVAN
ncbi:DUF4845 domain-containing protein [Candidatus Vondammii sp. HM_W22]|uniref:DUF4845 domain-containing protein n=1 Tax=Candidatus Vondammii sp. HM_W22 TaxID=2687299 RepID=UPI001F12F25F|nr:DUF4845 domain-containing protein [Candidatus Vondammii sp. HM_W22]